jgi:hypothetical protein
MKTWENIIKEKLERSDSALPEGLFTEFLARLDASGSPGTAVPAVRPAARRRPLLWALAPAAAAGLAAVLLFRQPSVPENGIQVLPQPEAPVAMVTDPAKGSNPEETSLETNTPVTQLLTPKSAGHPAVYSLEQVFTESAEPAESSDENPAAESVTPEMDNTSIPEPQDEKHVSAPVIPASSPYIPNDSGIKPVGLKAAPAAGAVAGGGLLTVLLTQFIGSGLSATATPVFPGDIEGDGRFATYEQMLAAMKDRSTGEHKHYPMLVKGGISVGIPISERLKITTGLEYSQYRSSFTWYFVPKDGGWPYYGEKEQLVQYLGMPLRLDWSFAKSRMLDVYIGGGIAADYCIGATLTDKRPKVARTVENLDRDGFVFYLLGASGVQVNVNKRVGFYLEPEVTWTGAKARKSQAEETTYPPGYYGTQTTTSESDGLETYRTEHPLMFSLTTGLRINLGK